MTQPEIVFALKPGTVTETLVRGLYESQTVGPFEASDHEQWIYFPSVRLTARVVRSDRVVYWARQV